MRDNSDVGKYWAENCSLYFRPPLLMWLLVMLDFVQRCATRPQCNVLCIRHFAESCSKQIFLLIQWPFWRVGNFIFNAVFCNQSDPKTRLEDGSVPNVFPRFLGRALWWVYENLRLLSNQSDGDPKPSSFWSRVSPSLELITCFFFKVGFGSSWFPPFFQTINSSW